ncbi:hypothetical protein IFM89_019923 [Coptis chinensis]|uniref:peptidylprolyl isomerase n=1 Tax=Coptis chinensis TaxID=261450 RepID=A0A835I4Z3_9MAGN|nr:hypothetical protein IFM89_019923 [Coptis chinensis]
MKHLDVAGGTGDVAFRILDNINSISRRAVKYDPADNLNDETQIYVRSIAKTCYQMFTKPCHSKVKYEAQLEDGTVVSKFEGVDFTVGDGGSFVPYFRVNTSLLSLVHVLPLQPGYFCPALSKAIKTMKKGEKVLLTVKATVWLWGDGPGAEGAVPPTATLLITLELVRGRLKTVTEVTNDKKVIKKKIIKEGEVKLIGKLQDGTVFLKTGHDDDELFEFKMDEEQVIDGLDRAVMTMKKGEVVESTIALEYGFGSSEFKQELAVVTPNSTLYYEVELESFVKERELWDMNTPEKIEAAGKKKEEGNDAFKAGKYALATENLLVIRLENLLNMTPTSVKRKQNSPRALYRHAQAYIQLANLDLAGIDIKKVLEIDPNTVKLIGKLQDGTVFLKTGHDDDELFEFKMDEELAVVPPNSTLYYEVELESFVKERESWDMNTPEKIEASGKKEEEGTVTFKAGKVAGNTCIRSGAISGSGSGCWGFKHTYEGCFWNVIEELFEGKLLEGTVDPGNPAILGITYQYICYKIVGASQFHLLISARGLQPLTVECSAAKLFAKHMKVEDQVSMLKSRVNIASVTPSRIKKLIGVDALGLLRLSVIVMDMHTDAKGYSLLALPQVSEEFWDLYKSHFHQLKVQGDLRICLYGPISCACDKKSAVTHDE